MSPEANKTVVRRYFEAVHNQRQLAVMDEIFAPELVEAIRKIVAMFVTAFPNYH